MNTIHRRHIHRSLHSSIRHVFFVVLALLFAKGAIAGDMTLVDQIKKKFPNTPIDDVRMTPIPGLIEVITGKSVLYVDQSLRYALFGGMVDTQTGINLTDARLAEINKIDVSTLPVNHSITIGSGKKHIFVFSDPDCPFCKQLHPELSKLKDVTIHVFLYPIKELHPNAFYHAVAVWCSADRVSALNKIFSGKSVPDNICEHPIADNVALGQELKITGTPTIIFENGSMWSGFLEADKLQAKVNGQTTKLAGNPSGMVVKEVK